MKAASGKLRVIKDEHIVEKIRNINRGYEDISLKLSRLGADIKEVSRLEREIKEKE